MPPKRDIPWKSEGNGMPKSTQQSTIKPAAIFRGKSRRKRLFWTMQGYMSAEMPTMTKVLMMLEPRILVIAKSVEWFATDTMFTTNSGIDVPKATMVMPIIKSLICSFLARLDAPHTSQSAPLRSSTSPTTNVHPMIIGWDKMDNIIRENV